MQKIEKLKKDKKKYEIEAKAPIRLMEKKLKYYSENSSIWTYISLIVLSLVCYTIIRIRRGKDFYAYNEIVELNQVDINDLA